MRTTSLCVLLVAFFLSACERSNFERQSAPPAASSTPGKPLGPEDGEERPVATSNEAVLAPSGTSPNSRPSESTQSSTESNAPAEALDAWAAKGKGHARVALFDLERGAWLVESRADEFENPASTQKILTAAATLDLLGPAHTFKTEIFGSVERGRASRLTIRGGGAPDLSTSDLWRLSRVLVEGGLSEVGAIFVDQSRFDENSVPPAFEQQPDEWAAFRAPVSALSLDRNTIELNVLPQAEGQPARSWFQPPGASSVRGRVQTGPPAAGDKVTWSLTATPGGAPLVSELGGTIASDLGRTKYARRLDDPRLVPGFALRELLAAQGVKVGSEVRLGANDGARRLVQLDSEPLGVLVRALGKESDNFTAETLLIALSQLEVGAPATTPWSTERGLAVLRRWLGERGLGAEGVVLRNGSGLFDANRLSPRVLARTLRFMWNRPGSNAEFVGQLAMGGQDGTLRARFAKGPLAGRVRAKTGTLRDVSALSGYVLRADGRAPLAFAVLLSGTAGRQDEARRRIDQTLAALVALAGP